MLGRALQPGRYGYPDAPNQFDGQNTLNARKGITAKSRCPSLYCLIRLVRIHLMLGRALQLNTDIKSQVCFGGRQNTPNARKGITTTSTSMRISERRSRQNTLNARKGITTQPVVPRSGSLFKRNLQQNLD